MNGDIVKVKQKLFRVDWSLGGFEFAWDCDIDKKCENADYIRANEFNYKVCEVIDSIHDKESGV